MTEAEWLACEKPAPMLTFLRGRVSDRKLRLFACACSRSVRRFIPNDPCRAVLDLSLRFADGQATADDLARARAAAVAVADSDRARSCAAWAACECANPSAQQGAVRAADWSAEQLYRSNPRAAEEEQRAQAEVLRDIIGNPFREVRAPSLRRAAQNPRVREIAEEIYEAGLQEDMKELANELEANGCTSWEVLDHCRREEPHAHGCWVIDRILGFDASPAPPAPAASAPGVERVPSERVQEIRRLLSEFLGPKKFRRAVRLAVAQVPGPGLVRCPARWDDFVRIHPEYKLEDDELAEVFAFCTIHGCELTERVLRGAWDDPTLLRNPKFLEARGTQFPHSHSPEAEGEWESRAWICPECVRCRAEWIKAQE